jgi:hypothetical protein
VLNAGAPTPAAALTSARAQKAYAAIDDASIATRKVGARICHQEPRVGAFATQPWSGGSPCALPPGIDALWRIRPPRQIDASQKWHWDGQPAIMQSRAVDETGYVQPTLAELLAVRGENYYYHNNAIWPWRIASGGEVTNALA